jgi:uncharacterized membrane protein YhaH (DUF805 family)
VWHLCHFPGRATRRMLYVMALAMAIFFVLLLVASIAGLTVDSRDSADWKPTDGGFRSA